MINIFRRKKKNETPPPATINTTVAEREQMIHQALLEMNCQPQWEDQDENRAVHYEYQNGHFRILVEKDTPVVRLMYLFFYNVSAKYIDRVRQVCNNCNTVSPIGHMVYSVNADRYEVDMHMFANFVPEKGRVLPMLRYVMQGVFYWQQAFAHRYEEQSSADTDDAEANLAKWNHEVSLMRRMELYMQHEGDMVETSSEPFTLADMLRRLMGIEKIHVEQFTLLTDQLTSTANDDKCLEQQPAAWLEHTTATTVTGTLLYHHHSAPTQQRTLMFSLTRAGGDDVCHYYRITMCRVPVSADMSVDVHSVDHHEQSASALIAYDLKSNKQMRDESMYMWKEAMEKYRAGHEDQLTPQERLLCQCSTSDDAHRLYRGHQLFLQGRYVEALDPLLSAYAEHSHSYDKMHGKDRERFNQICYYISFCYMQLGQYALASHYMSAVPLNHRVDYAVLRVDSMVLSGDAHSMRMIEDMMKQIDEAHHGEDEDQVEMSPVVGELYEILRRRQVFLLIERGELDQAEEKLRQMLTEDRHADFAIHEMAYVQRRRYLNDVY
ncbi:MAG: hypothetical protein II562_06250 [Prevotella sp.]|nr:hypothetical protein [Prevotella sp.]